MTKGRVEIHYETKGSTKISGQTLREQQTGKPGPIQGGRPRRAFDGVFGTKRNLIAEHGDHPDSPISLHVEEPDEDGRYHKRKIIDVPPGVNATIKVDPEKKIRVKHER